MQRRMQNALIDWSIGGIWFSVRLNNFLLSPIACEILTIGAFNRQLSFSTWNAMTKSDSIPFEIICNVTFLLIALACVFPWLCLLKLLSLSIFIGNKKWMKGKKASWNHQFTRFIGHIIVDRNILTFERNNKKLSILFFNHFRGRIPKVLTVEFLCYFFLWLSVMNRRIIRNQFQ